MKRGAARTAGAAEVHAVLLTQPHANTKRPGISSQAFLWATMALWWLGADADAVRKRAALESSGPSLVQMIQLLSQAAGETCEYVCVCECVCVFER